MAETHRNRTTRQLSSQQRRTLHRRGMQLLQNLKQQVARGRPEPCWRLCGVDACGDEERLFQIPLTYLRVNEFGKQQVSTETFLDDFARSMTDKLLPDDSDAASRMCLHRGLRSFISSPPVRTAFVLFYVEALELEAKDQHIQEAVMEALPRLKSFMMDKNTEDVLSLVHKYLNPEAHGGTEDWSLTDYVVQFVIHIEVWRGYDIRRSREWDFGSEYRVAELLASILVKLWLMSRDRHFTLVFKGVNDSLWNCMWEEWLDCYPTVEPSEEETLIVKERAGMSEDKVLEEIGYLGGVGIGSNL